LNHRQKDDVVAQLVNLEDQNVHFTDENFTTETQRAQRN
jgi:hypothetical protein